MNLLLYCTLRINVKLFLCHVIYLYSFSVFPPYTVTIHIKGWSYAVCQRMVFKFTSKPDWIKQFLIEWIYKSFFKEMTKWPTKIKRPTNQSFKQNTYILVNKFDIYKTSVKDFHLLLTKLSIKLFILTLLL